MTAHDFQIIHVCHLTGKLYRPRTPGLPSLPYVRTEDVFFVLRQQHLRLIIFGTVQGQTNELTSSCFVECAAGSVGVTDSGDVINLEVFHYWKVRGLNKLHSTEHDGCTYKLQKNVGDLVHDVVQVHFFTSATKACHNAAATNATKNQRPPLAMVVKMSVHILSHFSALLIRPSWYRLWLAIASVSVSPGRRGKALSTCALKSEISASISASTSSSVRPFRRSANLRFCCWMVSLMAISKLIS